MYPTKPLWEILDKNFSIWKIPVKEYLKEWTLPIIDQWKNFIWWYTNDYSQKYNWNLPVLVYWDHTNSVKFIDFDFTWWADGIKIFKFWEKIDTKYMFYVINYYKPENLWYRRHFSILKQIQIPLPSLQTQQKIVQKLDNLFSKIDKNIELTKQNIANINEENNAILEKIFMKCEKEFGVEKIEKISDIWPQKSKVKNFSGNVSFVPMKDLNEKQKFFEAKEIKNISEVYKWYTYFENDDVLLAKVTPCFENWKSWVAKNLENWIWFGSSEFYVFRCSEKILPEFLYYKISSDKFLKEWKENMAGAVGLQRVQKKFLENLQIPLPPLPNQQEIVEKLDKIFAKNSELKNFYEKNLKNLEELKQSILKQAFEDENFIK